MTQKLQFHSLDMLRGITAITVALFHAGWVHVGTQFDLVKNAVLMVDLFFVLSGFVISYNYEHKLRTRPDAAVFMKRRFWRVWPLHAVMLVVFIGIEMLRFAYERSQGIVLEPAAFSNHYFERIFAHIFLIQSLGPFPDHAEINAVSWWISVEFYTYLLFALLCLTGRLRAALLLAAGLGSVWIIFTFHGKLTGDARTFGLYRSVYSFAIGFFVYRAFIALQRRTAQTDRRI